MAFQFSSLKHVLDTLDGLNPLGVSEIAEILGKSTVIVHKYVKELVNQGKLKKVGIGPKTKYILVSLNSGKNTVLKKGDSEIIEISFSDKKLLDEIFLKYDADGKILKGYTGILKWCKDRNLDPKEKITSYLNIHHYIEKIHDNCGLIDAGDAFGKDFDEVFLDNVYYADQYKWMDFGRGKLAEMTFYGKQSQNKTLILESIDEVYYRIECLIQKESYSAIAITPWSIERKNQFLKILKNKLTPLGVPFVQMVKYYPNAIAIPQKTLKTREQRILNAKNTIFVDDPLVEKYKKVLLIDDFVGSGSTLNETAKKLKEGGVKIVDAFAFVGNTNLNYEVINEI
ncbi:MAG: phosphoribosyltransferase family protein [Candidatus Gracilibacteria bacterium]